MTTPLSTRVAGARRWQDIAADMIEARKFSINGQSSDEEVTAAAFVFDEGILYLPEAARAEIVTALRALSSSQDSPI